MIEQTEKQAKAIEDAKQKQNELLALIESGAMPTKGRATPEQLAEMRKKHGIVYEIFILSFDGVILCGYLKEPDWLCFCEAVTKESPLERGDAYLSHCWIEGYGATEMWQQTRNRVSAALAALQLDAVPMGLLKKSSEATLSPMPSTRPVEENPIELEFPLNPASETN